VREFNEERALVLAAALENQKRIQRAMGVKRRLLVPLGDDYSSLFPFLFSPSKKYRRIQFLFLFCFFFLSVNCCVFL